MEEVLRVIYEKERPELRRQIQRSKQKSLIMRRERTLTNKSKQRYLNTLENHTQSTHYERTDENARYHRMKQKSFPPTLEHRRKFHTIDHAKPQKQLHLPSLSRMRKPTQPGKGVNQLRVSILAVCFVVKLKKLRKKKMLNKKQQTNLISANLLKIIQKMVTSYYSNFLEEQLSYYVSLIQLKLESPQIDLSKEVLNNLYFMAKKLSESTIRKDFFEFLVSVSKNNSFFPSQFLSEFEMCRLQFSPKMGCLVNVSSEQTRMIVGICIGIKLFCAYILYKPWLLKLTKIDLVKNFDSVRQFISQYGSVFYYLILDEFTALPAILLDTSQKQTLGYFRLRPMEKINICPPGYNEKYVKSTSQELIYGQDRSFLKKLKKIDVEKVNKIKYYLVRWVDRVTALILKHQGIEELLVSQRSHHRSIRR